eukprot:589803-Hanusia_phi.AAC.1
MLPYWHPAAFEDRRAAAPGAAPGGLEAQPLCIRRRGRRITPGPMIPSAIQRLLKPTCNTRKRMGLEAYPRNRTRNVRGRIPA